MFTPLCPIILLKWVVLVASSDTAPAPARSPALLPHTSILPVMLR